jgi:hypothetical protein
VENFGSCTANWRGRLGRKEQLSLGATGEIAARLAGAAEFSVEVAVAQGVEVSQVWNDTLGITLGVAACVSAPNQTVAALTELGEAKGRLQGCIASLVALNTVWQVGRATYLPELGGYAGLDAGSLDKVISRSLSPWPESPGGMWGGTD